MVTKISLDELNVLLSDPNVGDEEIGQYFKVEEELSGPFEPAIVINPDTVDLPTTLDARARSAGVVNAANYIERQKRRFAFNAKKNDSHYRGPIIVSEGDSWFQYPFILTDVIDHLMKKYAIFSLDAAGDTLSNMFKEAEYVEALTTTDASILLFSGGGNDVVAGGNLAEHLRDYDASLSAAQHLKPSFDAVLDDAIGMYSKIVRQIAINFPSVEIVCHGYDYVIPANGRWLGKPMAKRGIIDPQFQRSIATVMIDRFNERMKLLEKTSARMNYIDCRNVVGDDGWYDELHPTTEGYGRVAAKFQALISTLSAKKKIAPPKPASASRKRKVVLASDSSPFQPLSSKAYAGPLGRSLHIGLNSVSPEHYAGWSGPLTACEFDAMDMGEIAEGLGYESTTLLTNAATRKSVIDEIKKAAADLKEGDIFFVTYSGHGGQVPDFNGDEEDDGLDETWCLFDGQLIDDELYELWSMFKSGVRVLVLSDSCHSGTVVRNTIINSQMSTAIVETAGEGVRAMPFNIASRTFRQNRKFYTDIGREAPANESRKISRAKKSPVSCSVKLISGCQDNQESLDGVGNGAFTAALIEVWDHGRFTRDYQAFRKAIAARLRDRQQSPNLEDVGAHNPIFDAQPPFAI